MRRFRHRLPRLAILTALLLGLPHLAMAYRFDHLSVSVTPLDGDVYRLDVAPRATAQDAASSFRSEGGATELVARDGWLEIRRLDAADAPPVWRGRLAALASYGRAGVPGTRLEWSAAADEAIYGLGQRFNGLNQAGKRVEMWIRDVPGQGDASYHCTPVLFSSRGYALFAADNPDGEFSLNPIGEGLHRYFRAGQAWTFYVAVAPTLKDLVQRRAAIQGPFRGVPDWAWGPWISRNSYENQGEAEEAIRGMVERGFPVSAIVQEAWKGSSHTGDFNNFSKDRWPDLDGFFALCARHGIRNVLWQVAIIHPSSPDFAEAERRRYFVKKPDGSVSWRLEWLEGFANVDFTNPEAARWWKDQMRDEVRRGVRGFKADDGEDIKPDDVFFDGRRGWQMHNEYSALYDRALTELFDEEQADGLLWCRSASLGFEATPALWAGDQFATWAQYRSLLPAGLSAGLSGAPFWGHDIGGYIDQPSPELYIRWLQFGAFSPLMQYHGVLRREPWEFGPEAERAYRLLSHLRMNLRPLLKALGDEAVRTGLPLMRPMAMEFPDDARFLDEDTQYMLGPDLLVAPVLEEGAAGRRIKFPSGAWQHLLMPVAFTGPSEVEVPIDLVSAPVFVRQGAAIEVELAESAKLGTWSNGAPVRALAFDAARAVLVHPEFPLTGSTLSGRARFSFDVAPEFAGSLQAYSYPIERPNRRTALEVIRKDGVAAIDLHYAGARESAFGIVVHDGSNVLFSGTLKWRSPLALEAEPVGSRVVRGGERAIRTRLVNRSGDALAVRMTASADARTTLAAPAREHDIPAFGTWDGEWRIRVEDTEHIDDCVVRFTASSGGRPLAQADTSFVRPLRLAVAGPFPGHEKKLFETPFPPEWNTSPDAMFRTTEGTARWIALSPEHQERHDGVDFEAIWGERDHAAAYVMAHVRARAARNAELRIGADDTITAWLNGERVSAKEVYRLAEWDQEIVPVRLAAGDNLLVFKIAQDRNPWRFLLHLTAPGGGPLEGVADALDVHAYRADREEKGPVVETPGPIPWRIAGPYPVRQPQDLAAAGELDDLARLRDPLSATGVTWRAAADLPEYNGTVTFTDLYGPRSHQDAYAVATWTVEQSTPVVFHCGSDDGIALWLNGRPIHAAHKARGFKPGEDAVRATLQPGRNVLFCRVRQGEGAWKFRVDAWDHSQKPIRPLGAGP